MAPNLHTLLSCQPYSYLTLKSRGPWTGPERERGHDQGMIKCQLHVLNSSNFPSPYHPFLKTDIKTSGTYRLAGQNIGHAIDRASTLS